MFGGYGEMMDFACECSIFNTLYLDMKVPFHAYLTHSVYRATPDLPCLKIWAKTVRMEPRTVCFSVGTAERARLATCQNMSKQYTTLNLHY